MALFKKLTKKIVADVKETVAEEAKKTSADVKDEIVDRVSDILPVVIAFGVGVLVAAIFRKPQTIPVTVKVVLHTAK